MSDIEKDKVDTPTIHVTGTSSDVDQFKVSIVRRLTSVPLLTEEKIEFCRSY